MRLTIDDSPNDVKTNLIEIEGKDLGFKKSQLKDMTRQNTKQEGTKWDRP